MVVVAVFSLDSARALALALPPLGLVLSRQLDISSVCLLACLLLIVGLSFVQVKGTKRAAVVE